MTSDARPSFLVDMNLSPRWVEAFASIGYEAIHWSELGEANSPDADIMSWALTNERVVFTFDLDFGRMVALAHARGPSLLQVRVSEALPRQILPLIEQTVARYCHDLMTGAIVTIDDLRTRVRILPL